MRFSEIVLKPHKYKEQIDNLFHALINPPQDKLLKEVINPYPFRVIMIELSKIWKRDLGKNSGLLSHDSDKISGICLICCDELVRKGCESKRELVDEILEMCRKHFKGRQFEEYFEKIYQRFYGFGDNLVLCLNCDSLSERITKGYLKSVGREIRVLGKRRKKKINKGWKV